MSAEELVEGVSTEETTFEFLAKVIDDLDKAFSVNAYLPHTTAKTIEEMWEARGMAKVLDRCRELYKITYGEDYVPRCFKQHRPHA